MTSKRHWSILIALLLIFSLLLAACVRPLPGDDETQPEETSGEAYPAPVEAEGEDTSAEGYPVGEDSEGGEAGLLQPAEEGEDAEAYPGAEGEAVEREHAEGEAVEDEHAEGETAEGEAAEGEHVEGEAAEGEHVEGEAAEDEHSEGESVEGEHVEGEAAEDEHAEGETTEDETAEGEAVEDEAAEGEAAEGEAVETGRTHTVQLGETLFRIGMQYGMSWVALAQANDITNPNSLYPGQVLVIPDVETLEGTEASTGEAGEAATEEPETETPAVVEESELPAEGEVITVYVGPELKDCVGVGPQTCMQLKTDPDDDYIFFYDQIEGFEYEPGYEYELLVLVEPVENAPADASTLKYTLVEEVSKTPVSTAETDAEKAGDQKTVYVGPEQVDCEGEGPQTCFLIKENPDDEWTLYYYGIDGFDYEPGYEYELLITENQVENPPAGGSSLTWTLDEVVNKTPVETEDSVTEETTYIVQFGDTLYSISYRYGVSMMEIARENDLLNFNQIYAGQELVIPQVESEEEADAETETAAGEEAEATHEVQEGETVFTIAFKYGIAWTELVEANEIASPYTLEVGQSLVIPPAE